MNVCQCQGIKCLGVSWNELLERFMEWNVWQYHEKECWDVSKNGMFGGPTEWNGGLCQNDMLACIKELNFQKSHGMESLRMSYNGMLTCAMEWNVGKCKRMECWEV